MPPKPNSKATSKRAKPRLGAKPPAKQGTVTGDEAIIKQARAEADASEAADRAALKSDPAFIAWAKSTEVFERASAAAKGACKPYDDAAARISEAHPNGFAPGSKEARDFAALRSARNATERRTLAEHGYPVHDDPDTPGRLLELVEALESSRRMMALVGVGVGPSGDALTDREATKLWDRAAAMCGARDSLPGLPMPATSGAARLHQLREWCALCNADQAYGAASEFLTHLGTFVFHSRHHAGQTSSGKKPDWGSMYAMAFIPAFDLPLLVSGDLRRRADSLYPPGSPPIKVGRLAPHASVIEAVAELASAFRNVLFAGRRCPLDPNYEQFIEPAKARATKREVAAGRPAAPVGWGADFEELKRGETRAAVRKRLGIKSRFEAEELIAAEWRAQTLEHEAAVLGIAQFKSIDLDELAVMLGREASAVLNATGSAPPGPTAPPLGANGGSDDASTESVEEKDFGLLRYLRKTSPLRKKISDMSPPGGPTGRKAIALRLKALSRRDTPLVEINTKGVVITQAGITLVDSLDPPTPQR